jgi:uncharacterized lipoprotein YajG
MHMRHLPLMACLILLSACAMPPASVLQDGPTVPVASEDSCGAGQYAGLIGQDATSLERVLIMGQVRLIRPDQAVTMDFSAERINFWIGADNRIVRITCG